MRVQRDIPNGLRQFFLHNETVYVSEEHIRAYQNDLNEYHILSNDKINIQELLNGGQNDEDLLEELRVIEHELYMCINSMGMIEDVYGFDLENLINHFIF